MTPPAPPPVQIDRPWLLNVLTVPPVGNTGTEGSVMAVRQLDPNHLTDHRDRLYRAALGLCRSRHDAEDLVQETYARVLAKPRFLRDEHDSGYLMRALRNTFYSRHRTATRHPLTVGLPDEVALLADRKTPPMETLVEALDVLRAVTTLKPAHRDVVVAVDIQGMSYAEAARALGTPEGTVMSRLHRARQALARRLGPA